MPQPIIDIIADPVKMTCGQCGHTGKLYQLGMQSVFWCPRCSPEGLQEFCERFIVQKLQKIRRSRTEWR